MTGAAPQPGSGFDVLACDAEAAAAWIFAHVPADKAAGIAAALQRRMWQGQPSLG